MNRWNDLYSYEPLIEVNVILIETVEEQISTTNSPRSVMDMSKFQMNKGSE